MNEKWNHRDLRLSAEKRRIGETSTIKEEWSRHVPSDKRTMQQTDHDAWEYAVRNGLI